MCACTYYSLFKLGIFSSFYYMVPGCTSAYSLLVNAALMCRFAPPLCYNFLHLIHVDDPTDGGFRSRCGSLPLLSPCPRDLRLRADVMA